jgi:hypothetical protein
MIKFFINGDTHSPERRQYDGDLDFFIPNLTEKSIKRTY